MADGAALGDEQRFTYVDYKAWELREGERYELIGGVPYAMSAPSDRHQAVLVALAAAFYNFFKGGPCKVRPAPYDVRLFYRPDETDDTVVQPDLSVICDEKKRGPEGCRGAPDLVVEILSPSNTAIEMSLFQNSVSFGTSSRKNRAKPGFSTKTKEAVPKTEVLEQPLIIRKFDLYRRAGVREYWVVSPEEKTIHAYCFQDEKMLSRVYTAAGAAGAVVFPELEIALEPVFAE
jgi:Uma2 family endonuclease